MSEAPLMWDATLHGRCACVVTAVARAWCRYTCVMTREKPCWGRLTVRYGDRMDASVRARGDCLPRAIRPRRQ